MEGTDVINPAFSDDIKFCKVAFLLSLLTLGLLVEADFQPFIYYKFPALAPSPPLPKLFSEQKWKVHNVDMAKS